MSFEFKRMAVGALALTAAVVVGCGGSDSTDSSSDAGSPEDAVQAFFDASKAEDGAAACAALTTDSQELAAGPEDSCEASFDKSVEAGTAGIPDSIEIGEVTTEGDTAATVSVTADGQTSDIYTTQEDGVWKVDLAGPTSVGGDSSAPSTDSTTG